MRCVAPQKWFSALALLVLFSASSWGADNRDVTTLEKGNTLLKTLHQDFVKDPKKSISYNNAYLKLQAMRLEEEIKALERKTTKNEAPWQEEARKKTLAMKKESLAQVREATKKLETSPNVGQIFRSPNDIREFLKTNRIRSLRESRSKPTGAVSKTMDMPTEGPDLARSRFLLEDYVNNVKKSSDLVAHCDWAKQAEATLKWGDEEMIIELSQQIPDFFEEEAFAIKSFEREPCDSDSEDASVFFQGEKKKSFQPFLNAVGIKSPPKFDYVTENDLSSSFGQPRSQYYSDGKPSKACTAFALTSDMQFTGKTPPLSPGLAYGMVQSANTVGVKKGTRLPDNLKSDVVKKIKEWGTPNPDEEHIRDVLDQGATIDEVYDVLSREPLAPESDFPFPNLLPEKLSEVKNRKYQLKGYSSVDVDTSVLDSRRLDEYRCNRNLNFGLMAMLIDAGQPPQVVIATEARVEKEDWIEPFSSGGGIKHIVNVVGYGEDIDPFDLKRKPYFLIRDSLGKELIHYKVDAHKFMSYSETLLKVTKVEVLDQKKK